MRVLVLKTSSMGDVIHALPALTDARRAKPDIVFDWVVEEAFAEIPSWHPAVDQVIPVALRRWRKSIFKASNSTEWREFRALLGKRHYDLVIDCQGLLKSAWLGTLVKASVAGYDRRSVREPLASFFYRHRYQVNKKMHAVERIRSLFAQALDYELPHDRGDYGLDSRYFGNVSDELRSIVFLHATARDDKLYPEAQWRELAQRLTSDGYQIRLPWGSEAERQRAQRIAAGIANVEVLPRLTLHGVACVLVQARAVVAVDTGLGHLSAALSVPTLSLYGPTDPGLIGAYGDNQYHLGGKQSQAEPFAALKAGLVYNCLQEEILGATG